MRSFTINTPGEYTAGALKFRWYNKRWNRLSVVGYRFISSISTNTKRHACRGIRIIKRKTK